MHGSGWCVPHDGASARAGTSLACAATWAPVRGSGGQAWRARGVAEVHRTVCGPCTLGAGGGSGLGPERRHQKEGEAWSVPSGTSGVRDSVGSPSDGDNQMRRKSRDGRKQPSLPVSSPTAASLPASGEVGLPAWCTPCSSVPRSSPRLPPSWALESVSGFQLAPALGPFPAVPRPRPVPPPPPLPSLHSGLCFGMVSWPPRVKSGLPSCLHPSLTLFPCLAFLHSTCILTRSLCDCLLPLLEGTLLQSWDNVLFIPESYC